MTDAAARPYAITLLGATGFTGRLAAEYLARVGEPGLAWAIAGRSRDKLEALKRDLVAIDPTCAAVGVIEADVGDPASLARLAASTRVVATTVGPYAKYGEAVVQACVDAGTDYVDITGEPAFVQSMIDRYDEAARAKGVRIVNCCGFDSIPHDLGVLYTVLRAPEGVPLRIEGLVRAHGGMSGGTWQSAVNAFGNLRESMGAAKPPREALPGGRTVRALPQRLRYDGSVGAWLCPLPTIDPWMVLRSARAIDRYGPDFRYGHFAEVHSTATLAGAAVGITGIVALAQFGPTRAWLAGRLASGEGPSAAQRAKSWFTVTFRVKSEGRSFVTRVSGGDAGYTETAKMIAEAAQCLVLNRDRLPPHTGVVTPAMGLGEPLIDRLQRAGMAFRVLQG